MTVCEGVLEKGRVEGPLATFLCAVLSQGFLFFRIPFSYTLDS